MRRLVAACVCVVVVACAPTEAEVGQTTTTSVVTTAATTTTSSTTTTIVAPTTSPSTTTVPESEVPAELLALIGAPMPEVDLTIDGPEDVERWIGEFLRWEAWVSANPQDGFDSLEANATGKYLEGMKAGLSNVIEAGVVAVGGELQFKGLQVEFGDAGVGIVSFSVDSRRASTRFTLKSESLEVVNRLEPSGEWVTSDALLFMSPSGAWQLVEWASR